jgi:FlaA1/EpsC-like NDP-sugar epimerase
MSLLLKLCALLLRLRNRHFFGLDLLFLALTPALALALRTDGQAFAGDAFLQPLAIFTLAALGCKFLIFFPLGLYARFWRYASAAELALIVVAGLTATLLEALAFFAILRPLALVPANFPRSLPFLDGLLTIAAVGGLRFSARLADWAAHRWRPGIRAERVLVMGAGDAGSMIVKEMRANPHLGLEPVGFVDDDPEKRGVIIHGLRVLGPRADIPRLTREYRIRTVIIAMPTAPGRIVREVAALCEEAGVASKIIPGIYELLDGAASVRQLREVRIEDLLRREPVHTDTTPVAALLAGKRVLVTGAGGSIGSELCRQILRCGPAELVLLGHGENSIFEITNELRTAYSKSQIAKGDTQSEIANRKPVLSVAEGSQIVPIIADIRHPPRMRAVFEARRPEIVFHAAAHKHVPLMEANATEAIANNVLGARCVIEASIAAGVSHFVLISTDKAVNPTSVMGATKRVSELLVQDAASRTGRAFVAVRFGNVLGSRGSVVPFFQRQIAKGGPITVTHPEIRRYFMTIPEAVQLVLQAATLGRGGEVFVLDMGQPVKIVDLARDLAELSGLTVGEDIDIVFTGLRPGEKLFEELFIPGEVYGRTAHNQVFVSNNGATNPLCGAGLHQAVDHLIGAAEADDQDALVRLIEEIVPEYRSRAQRNSLPVEPIGQPL